MDLTFVSHFTARPVPAINFKQYLSAWKDGVKSMSEVDIIEASRRYMASDGEYSDYTVEGVCYDNDSDYKALGFYGTLLLANNQVVKTHMVMHLGKEEFQGEIYVTFMNFPLDKPFERRFFSLWTILNKNMFKECTPFQWAPTSVPNISLEKSQLEWILKVITRQSKHSYVNTLAARWKFASAGDSSAESTKESTIETTTSSEPIAIETAADVPEVVPAAVENASVGATNAPAADTIIPADQIAKLQEQLDEYKSENEKLSEINEQLASAYRELKKDKKSLVQNIEDQKKRLKVLKKRVESAEARAKESINGDVKEFCDYFDKEQERLENECTEKDRLIEKLQQDLDTANGKITSLKGRLNKQSSDKGISGLLAAPEFETEKYEDEFGIAIFSALHKAIEKTPTKNNSPHTRCIDVWQAIIDANPDLEKAFGQFCDNKDALKNAIVSGELDKKKHLLNPFNLTYGKHTNCHGKITFGSDERYIASTASTASETAAGFSNCAKDLRNTFLYPT